ncbi:HEAT repeat domain-containing protein [Paenibacillus sp. EKM212P]|uniref:HEAT repeat domain-containing protein n=1 Tax=Paenibacillus sp. EKM212P TaxID=1683680 RepID=UPI001EEB6F18|nr:lipase chaperone [Paenibacillus sp. EKM212P]
MKEGQVMKINKTVVTIGTTILLISSVVPASLALNAASKDSTGFVKPTISSLKDLDHVEVLKSLNNAQTVNLSVYGDSDSRGKQTEYLKTLNGNELFETLGELSIYDEPNFEKYAESILPYLKKQWQGKVPAGVSDIVTDQEYNSKLRAFIIDILANGNKLDKRSLEKIKTVIENKSEDENLRRYALLQLEPQKDAALSAEEKSINLKAIFDDSNESVQVRSAAITAMRRLNDPHFKVVLSSLSKSENANDPLLRTLVTSAAKAGELDNYTEVVKKILNETKDEQVFESTIYALGVSGGEEAVNLVVQHQGKFKGNAEEIGKYSLLRNLNTISSMLKSQSDDKIITALKASEIINYGEVYPDIKEIHKNSKNSEVIKSAEHALETIIPENLVDEFNTKKWEGK